METKCAKLPLVSVIVPVYKVEAYLQTCVDSILEQHYENIEIILVDDGSPDRCPMICEEYAKKDPRIRVIHQENRGLPAARNTGLRAASGEWIICVDSDDLWKSDLLESVMAVASDAVDLIAFSYMPYPEGQPLPQPSPLRTGTYRTGKRELLNALQLGLLDEYHRAVPYYFGACWIELVRRDFLEENHLYFDESLKQCEDMIWNLNLLERAHSVGLLDKDLYYYRLRPDSMCHIHDKRLPGYLDTVDQRVVEFGQREKKGADFWAAYDIWLMKTYVRLLDKCYFNPANPDGPLQAWRAWRKMIGDCPTLRHLSKAPLKEFWNNRKRYVPLFFFRFRVPLYLMTRLTYGKLQRHDQGYADKARCRAE